jgi:conjugal transfer pilus assembly protein TraF
VGWEHRELKLSLEGRPVNAKAIEVVVRNQRSERAQSIAELARDHVVFFFFRGDCPYCHAYAPTLRAFEDQTGLKVVAVSLDGGTLPQFPRPRADNGISKTLQVTQVPATFIAQPFTGVITPVGFGVLSEGELMERIAVVTSPNSRAMVPETTKRISLQ